MTYLLDANVFIQAKNAYYGFDICPGFWDWLDQAHAHHRIASIDRIGDELKAGSDQLAAWAKSRPSLFLTPDASVIDSLRVTSAWAATSRYEQAAVREYTRIADAQLVAHAHAHGLTVVTHEIPSNGLKKIKIPDACRVLDVPYTSIISVLRSEGAAFTLSS